MSNCMSVCVCVEEHMERFSLSWKLFVFEDLSKISVYNFINHYDFNDHRNIVIWYR